MLILASQSPRRRELLGLLGIPFSVDQADLDERRLKSESAAEMTERLALAKAKAVYQRHTCRSWVLGGDTTVTIAGRVLGKPANKAEAVEMLTLLSGSTHEVISAVALIGDQFESSMISKTCVEFDQLSASEINGYCNSDEPYDKAGGYGIQGVAGCFVRKLQGSHSGVVGLPLYETRQLLRSAQLIE